MAYVYYKRKDYAKAQTYIEPAFITNSQNPVLLCTAGLIFAKMGNREKGKSLLVEGLKNNPVMPEDIKSEAEQELQKLKM
jgi:tetratricopeptide (TPR) repeat protein